MTSLVSDIPAASPQAAIDYFAAGFRFETDCWDVHASMQSGADFILLDVRSPALFARSHIAGAINLPHGKIVAGRLSAWPPDALLVTYCAGPHCNGAARGALRLARLGRPVKIMAGGICGWIDEGFELVTAAA